MLKVKPLLEVKALLFLLPHRKTESLYISTPQITKPVLPLNQSIVVGSYRKSWRGQTRDALG